MDVTIRDYEPSDREACLAVFETNVGEFFLPAERDEFAAFLDDLPGPYLVLEDGTGRVAACGGWALSPDPTVADLCWDMVERGRQGEGLGRRLVEARLARIREMQGVREVALRTSQLTRGFYERMGFVTERVVPDGFASGLDRCEMRRRLDEGSGDGEARSPGGESRRPEGSPRPAGATEAPEVGASGEEA